MTVFVVDLSGVFKGLHCLQPHFYPLLAKGQYRLLEGALTELAPLYEQVRLDLLHGSNAAASFIFVLGQSEPVRDEPFFKSSLCCSLALLKHGFVEKIAALGYQITASRVIVLDGLRREPHTGRPLGGARLEAAWELDCTGMTDACQELGFLFRQSDLLALDAVWGDALDLDGGVVNEGVGGLPAHLAQELESKVAAVLEKVDEIIGVKRRALQEFVESGNDPSPHLSERLFNEVREEFHSKVLRLKNSEDLSPLLGLRPSRFLSESVRSLVSADRHAGQLNIIRHRLPDGTVQTYQRGIFDLAFLILFIAGEDGRLLTLLDGKRVTDVIVELDLQTLREMYGRYIPVIQEAGRRLEDQVKDTIAADLEQYDEAVASCTADLGQDELPALFRVGLFRSERDVEHWNGWLGDAGTFLSLRQREVREKLEACAEQLRVKGRSLRRTASNDIEKMLRELRTKYQSLWEEVMQDSVPEKSFEWPKEVDPENKGFRNQAPRRPTAAQAFTTIASALLALGAAYGAGAGTTSMQDLSYWLPLPVLLLLSSLVGAGATLFWYSRKLRVPMGKAREAAKGLDDQLREWFAKGKILQVKLCQLDISRRNLELASRAADDATRQRLKLRYHHDQLKLHVLFAKSVLQVYGLEPEPGEFDSSCPNPAVNKTLPVFQNHIYCPTTNWSGSPCLEMFIGSSVHQQSASLVPALRKVSFIKADMGRYGMSNIKGRD